MWPPVNLVIISSRQTFDILVSYKFLMFGANRKNRKNENMIKMMFFKHLDLYAHYAGMLRPDEPRYH